MALKQTRRTVSLNRSVYDKALDAAHARNQTLAELVTEGLRAIGVDLPPTEHVPVAVVQHAQAQRQRIGAVKAKLEAATAPRQSLIRQQLGDAVADAMGEP